MSDQAKSSLLSQRSQPAESTRPTRKSSHPIPAVASTLATRQPVTAASGRQTRSRLRSSQRSGKEAIPEEGFDELNTPEEPVSIEVDIADPGTPEAQVPSGKAGSAGPVETESAATGTAQAVKAVADSSAPAEEVALSERDIPEASTDAVQIAAEAVTSIAICVSELSQDVTTGNALPEEQKATSKREKTCTKCNFSCTSSSEFSRHLHQNHNENSQEQSVPSGTNPAISARRNSKRKSMSSLPEIKMEKPVNGFSEESFGNMHEEDHSDEERLVIVEETRSGSVPITPTRSGPIQNRTYTCPQCPEFTTTSARACLDHKKEVHHDNSIIYHCDICDYATKYKQKLPRHRKLHFEGQDPNRSMASRDLNDSISSNNSNRMAEPEDDDDFPETEAVEEEVEEPTNMSGSLPVYLADSAGNSSAKKKGTRQEVDPAKYFTVVDEGKNKFACSSCGNIYKWRKSLNKHWKEKHSMEIPDNTENPAGLVALVKQGSIQQTGARLAVKIGGSLADGHSPGHGQDSNRSTPLNPTQFHLPSLPALDRDSPDGSPLVSHTSTIGPFVTNSSQPVFPGVHRMALFQHSLTPTVDQKEPLDLSDKGPDAVNKQLDPDWEPMSVDLSPQPSAPRPPKQPPLACDLCSFVGKTSVDYGNHIRTVHNNKKEFKCASCGEHFETSDELTNHFHDMHFHEIIAYKEIIQKIPHGLQQTYHLISMPLDDIASLSPQDLNGSGTEARPLKCNICDYEAKWPADLQKHAVSHSEQRPFACMVCGSTYKWKWDLVKHFDKSHERLPNPYKRKETSPAKPDDTGSEEASNDEQTVDSSNASPPPLSSMLANGAGSGATMHLGNASILESSLMSMEPQPCTSQQAADMDDIDLAHIQIPNVQSMITDVDHESRDAQRPINAKTQRAVSETVRNRISQNVSRSRSAVASQRQGSNQQLTQQCPLCDYRARWPSEITQHMKNHSNEKPHGCPICEYRSKWKWDVVKHLKRCGLVNGDGRAYTIHDVVDHTRTRNNGPPNVTVNMQGVISTPSTMQLSPAAQPTQTIDASVSPGAQGMVTSAQPVSLVLAAPTSTSPALSQRSTAQSVRPRESQRAANACSRCSFVASSQAELKRHSVIHSNSKPWMCQHIEHNNTRCEYSTRWKCDLKKHINAYSHHCPENDELLLLNFPQKCPHCNFQATKRDEFERHMQGHSMEGAKERRESTGRYLCKTCNETFSEMGDFLIHVKGHSTNPPARSSPVENDVDMQRIKHPRKNMVLLQCTECSFITNTQVKLAMHISEEHGTSTCPFCSDVILQRDFLAHVSRHEDFKPEEWQIYINACASCPEGSEEISAMEVMDNAQAEVAHRESRKTASGATKRSREIINCPYCNWDTDNILVLMEHVEKNHPVELADCRQRMERRTPTPPSGHQALRENGSAMTHSPKRAIDLSTMRASIPASKGVSRVLGEAGHPKVTPSPSGQAGLKKRPFQCTKCVFNTTNPTMYLRHVERHNSQAKHTTSSGSPAAPISASTTPRPSAALGDKPKRHTCPSCPFTHSDEGVFRTHTAFHGASLEYRCPKCDFSVGDVGLLNRHVSVHDSQEEAGARSSKSTTKKVNVTTRVRYWCSLCPYNTTCKNNIKKHMKPHLVQSNYRCDQCNYSATRQYLLEQHKTYHDCDPQVSFGPQDVVFDPYENENEIMDIPDDDEEEEGMDEEVDPGKYKCESPQCEFSTKCKKELDRHKSFHGAQFPYKCEICDYAAEKPNFLTQHKRAHPNIYRSNSSQASDNMTAARNSGINSKSASSSPSLPMSDNSDGDLMHCHQCPFSTSTAADLQAHSRQHGSCQEFTCDYCNWSHKVLSVVLTHRYVHQQEPFFDREPDERIFSQKEKEVDEPQQETPTPSPPALEQPKSPVAPVKPSERAQPRRAARYCCPICTFHSDSRAQYDLHSRLHSSKNLKKREIRKRFHCNLCPYSSLTWALVLHHKMKHDKSRGAARQLQEVVASQDPQVLQEEEPMETEAAADFPCDACPFVAASSQALQAHREGHEKEGRVRCLVCKFFTETEEDMVSHIVAVHHQGMDRALVRQLVEANMDKNGLNKMEIETNNNQPTKTVVEIEQQGKSPAVGKKGEDQKNENVAQKKEDPKKEELKILKVYSCHVCDNDFTDKLELKAHEKSHDMKSQ